MKKVGLLSFTKSYNYGASLQSYALEATIQELAPEIQCEYIDYIRDYKMDFFIWITRKIKTRILRRDDYPSWSIKEFLRVLIRRVFSKETMSQEQEESYRKFWSFIRFSRRVDKSHLKEIGKEYDIIIVGSDQVWNCGKVNLDKSYLLDFAEDSERYSYASSLGLKQIPEKYYSDYVKYLNKFEKISCREKSSMQLIAKAVSVSCRTDLDPTILLDMKAWSKISNQASPVSIKTPYVLVYDLCGKDQILNKFGDVFTTEGKFSLFPIYKEADVINGVIGPCEWVWLFAHADFILTNSFHGTAFALNFEKSFYVSIPNTDHFQSSKDRIYDLLVPLGLGNRIYDMFENKPISTYRCTISEVDYSSVTPLLDEMRKDSKDYLKTILTGTSRGTC